MCNLIFISKAVIIYCFYGCDVLFYISITEVSAYGEFSLIYGLYLIFKRIKNKQALVLVNIIGLYTSISIVFLCLGFQIESNNKDINPDFNEIKCLIFYLILASSGFYLFFHFLTKFFLIFFFLINMGIATLLCTLKNNLSMIINSFIFICFFYATTISVKVKLQSLINNLYHKEKSY